MAENRRRQPAKKSAPARGAAKRTSSGKPDAQRSGGRGSSSTSSTRRTGPSRSEGARGGRAGDDGSAPKQRVDQEVYDGPELPEDITGRELDHAVTAQLKSLPDKLATRVARHLAAAGTLIDDDPETAYKHTLAARARAPRLAIVREAAGEAAYAAGHYAEALAELRAAKRMNGATAYLPMMADCHRALGNPTQALQLAKSPAVANFAAAPKAEMTIVEAGARRDLGELDSALRTLELAPLTNKSREPWVVRLRYAYADILEAAGRRNDALTWFHRVDAIDGDGLTDAADRAAALERAASDD